MLFEAIQRQDPHKVALCDDTRAVSYGEIAKEVADRVQALNAVSVLGIALDNSVDWVLWDLAALKAGIPCVPVPPFFTDEQVSHLLRSAGVTHLLSSDGLHHTGMKNDNFLPAGTAKVTFTSGTTGTPKGVCLSKYAMENVARSIVDVLGDPFVGIHVTILPLSVLLENVAGVYAGLMAGCKIHLSGLQIFGKNYDNIHKVIQGTRASSVIFVPEILRTLMAQIAVQGTLPQLKFIAVGGSKIDESLLLQARKIGLPVYEGYGLSECGSVISLNTPEHDRPGSVGKILPHIKAQIIDNEIHIINPGFMGYIGENAPPIIKTGDIGQIDDSGFLSITGRKKNLLITSYGRNVSPEWVESVLLAQPALAQAVVYGDAKPYLSALLVPTTSDSNVKSAVHAANAILPDYAQIKDYRIVSRFTIEEGTLTGTGRPRRNQILKLYTKEKSDEFLQNAG